jgi:hypothetical protein
MVAARQRIPDELIEQAPDGRPRRGGHACLPNWTARPTSPP